MNICSLIRHRCSPCEGIAVESAAIIAEDALAATGSTLAPQTGHPRGVAPHPFTAAGSWERTCTDTPVATNACPAPQPITLERPATKPALTAQTSLGSPQRDAHFASATTPGCLSAG